MVFLSIGRQFENCVNSEEAKDRYLFSDLFKLYCVRSDEWFLWVLSRLLIDWPLVNEVEEGQEKLKSIWLRESTPAFSL